MCMETMDAALKTVYLRKTTKPGGKLRWRLLRVTTRQEENEEAHKACERRTVPKLQLRRRRRRERLEKLYKVLGDVGEKSHNMEKKEAVCERVVPAAAACMHRHPAGAMAPENTTQYLMSNVYEDMKADHSRLHSPQTSTHMYTESPPSAGVFTALDSDFESFLAFQQRDFEEEMLGLSW